MILLRLLLLAFFTLAYRSATVTAEVRSRAWRSETIRREGRGWFREDGGHHPPARKRGPDVTDRFGRVNQAGQHKPTATPHPPKCEWGM